VKRVNSDGCKLRGAAAKNKDYTSNNSNSRALLYRGGNGSEQL
jgi:hypothetical protein